MRTNLTELMLELEMHWLLEVLVLKYDNATYTETY